MALPATAVAATYYGPSFSTPTNISPGGTINIVLSTASGSSNVNLPQGSSTPCTGTCNYPQYAWTTTTGCFYNIHEVTVTDPDGDEWMLGSSATSGLYWSKSFGGSGSPYSGIYLLGDALNLTVGDSFTIPFGSGAGGFSFTSVLGSSAPNTVSPEGPYYWWLAVIGAGNPNGYTGGVRLDKTLVNPTLPQGKYIADVEGTVVCPTGSTPFNVRNGFDSASAIITPQFPLPMVVVVATGFAALLLARKSIAPKI
ncbi:MAG TPA: hypothetical protein VEJ36_06180 [Nitrososphaerales archaeon]|nr:hypothetical protein [Nitrososphaerales archaeon]